MYWLKTLGFTIEKLETNGNYFEYLAQELRRLPAVAQTYVGAPAFDRRERIAVAILAGLLYRLSRADRGSDELLCHGLHIKATKNAVPVPPE
jgi:hypothetical protein